LDQELKRIEYRKGMLKKGMKTKDLPVKSWQGSEITEDVRTAIDAEKLPELGGIYGDPNVGDPVQYDYLRLIFDHQVFEIIVFNRGIFMVFGADKRLLRIHRLLCKLEMLEKA